MYKLCKKNKIQILFYNLYNNLYNNFFIKFKYFSINQTVFHYLNPLLDNL